MPELEDKVLGTIQSHPGLTRLSIISIFDIAANDTGAKYTADQINRVIDNLRTDNKVSERARRLYPA